MKKAVTFAMAALMAAATWNPQPAEAAMAGQVTVVHKETVTEWKELLESVSLSGNCLKWGAVFWQGGCQVWPGESGTPVTPETPEEPVSPETPEEPGTPETPNKPVTPETPNKPGTSETPGESGTPVTPETPEEPGTPETPNKPVTPETPNKPATPETPNKPVTPETSNKPVTPETPEEPGTPETPETSNKPGTPGSSNKPGTSETPGVGSSSYAQQVVDLVNIERQKEGLSPLTIDEKLAAAADIRAKEIQTSFSHTRPNGSSFSTALKEAGAVYRRSGENIAWGQKSPEEVVKAWMNSSGHRANIMNKNYSRIGVSHVKNAAGTSYWVQLFAD